MAARRGYDTTWQRFRLSFLSSHPLCADCAEQGQTVVATEVHHVRKLAEGGERLDPENCRALCKPCHSTRTRRGE